jgi:hypothetical protein
MMSGVDEPSDLPHNAHWRMAVAVAGLIVMLTGDTPWVLVPRAG